MPLIWIEEYQSVLDLNNINSIVYFCKKNELCMACITEDRLQPLNRDGNCSHCEESLYQDQLLPPVSPPSPPKKHSRTRKRPHKKVRTMPTIPEVSDEDEAPTEETTHLYLKLVRCLF